MNPYKSIEIHMNHMESIENQYRNQYIGVAALHNSLPYLCGAIVTKTKTNKTKQELLGITPNDSYGGPQSFL